jgi:ribose-phosphate pyrophosphokinase
MELLIMIDALKRASSAEIIAVVPYYAYARQDRKAAPREPITAKLVADLLEAAGCTRLITMDLHAGQIQGFFNIPVDHLFALPIFMDDLRKRFGKGKVNDDIVIVSPDAGGVERARAYAKRLQSGLAIIDKRRPKANVAEVMNIIGDVEGKKAIIIDDMIDTAGTLTKAAEALTKRGATKVCAYATHAVLSGSARERIKDSVLDEVVVSDSIPQTDNPPENPKIRFISCASLVGEAMNRVHSGTSISSLFV